MTPVVTLDLPVVHERRGPITITGMLDTLTVEPVGRVVLLHGFARGPAALAAPTGVLVDAGHAVLRPGVPSFRRYAGMNDPALFDALADVIPSVLPGAGPIVLVGHSAGGAGTARMAARMARSGVAVGGVVLVDGNESLTPMLVQALTDLAHESPRVGIRLVAAAPNRCNRHGLTPRLIEESGVPFVGVRQRGGAHCELEGPKTDLVCRRMCGAAPDPARTAALHRLLVAWTSDLADRRPEPSWPTDVDRAAFEALSGSLPVL